ncbi:MAG: hypothetical protein ACRD12_01505 [Acidimicrobiales bacterium]
MTEKHDDREKDEADESGAAGDKGINDPLTRGDTADKAPRRDFGQDQSD